MLKLISFLTVLFTTISQPVRSSEIWATPIPDFKERHFPNFVLPANRWGAGHRGIDLVVEKDQELTSPFEGEVHFVGKVVNRQILTLKSKSGLLASFEPFCSELSKGERVKINQPIGKQCEGDSSYEIHCEDCLHFSVRSEYGYLNPLLFVSGILPSVIVS